MSLRFWVGILAVFVGANAFAANASIGGVCGLPAAPPLSQSDVEAIMNPAYGTDLLTREKQYYQLVQKQLLQDAVLLFLAKAPETVYAEFNPQDGPPGLDLGYGLKVVKRVDIGDKTIYVNEAWPFQRGHFQLPSEIRIRTRTFYKPGQSQGQEGSEYQYLNGRYRIAWDRVDQPHIYEEPGYLDSVPSDPVDSEPIQAQRAVRANIYNCMGCHLAGNPFTRRFVVGTNPIQYQSIVQADYFKVPFDQTEGYKQFIDYLKTQNASPQTLAEFRTAMSTPAASFHSMDLSRSMVGALCEKLRTNSFGFLEADQPFTGDPATLVPAARRDGIYSDGAALWRDSVDAILESQFGKYEQWTENHGTVPRQ